MSQPRPMLPQPSPKWLYIAVVVTVLAACGSLVTQEGILNSILELVASGCILVVIGLATLSTIRR